MVFNQMPNVQPQPYFNGYGQFSPYGYQTPVMQQSSVMQQTPTQQPVQTVQSSTVPGRVVRSVADVTPQEVPMDGSASLFPLQDQSAIYLKKWATNGTITTIKFVPEDQPKEEVKPSKEDEILESLEGFKQDFAAFKASFNQ